MPARQGETLASSAPSVLVDQHSRGRPSEWSAVAGWRTLSTGAAILLIAVTVAHAAGLRGYTGVVPIAVVGAACAIRSVPWAAVAVGLLAWGLATGFVVHAGGELSFGGPDLAAMAGCVLAALATCVAGALGRVHVIRAIRPFSPLERHVRG